MNAQKLARALGWFSVALGLVEVLAPKRLGRTLGMEGKSTLLRAYGLRELISGVGILSRPRPTGWVWSRVGGDALDLATLGLALARANPKRRNARVALLSVAAITVLDVLCGQRLRKH